MKLLTECTEKLFCTNITPPQLFPWKSLESFWDSLIYIMDCCSLMVTFCRCLTSFDEEQIFWNRMFCQSDANIKKVPNLSTFQQKSYFLTTLIYKFPSFKAIWLSCYFAKAFDNSIDLKLLNTFRVLSIKIV